MDSGFSIQFIYLIQNRSTQDTTRPTTIGFENNRMFPIEMLTDSVCVYPIFISWKILTICRSFLEQKLIKLKMKNQRNTVLYRHFADSVPNLRCDIREQRSVGASGFFRMQMRVAPEIDSEFIPLLMSRRIILLYIFSMSGRRDQRNDTIMCALCNSIDGDDNDFSVRKSTKSKPFARSKEYMSQCRTTRHDATRDSTAIQCELWSNSSLVYVYTE